MDPSAACLLKELLVVDVFQLFYNLEK